MIIPKWRLNENGLSGKKNKEDEKMGEREEEREGGGEGEKKIGKKKVDCIEFIPLIPYSKSCIASVLEVRAIVPDSGHTFPLASARDRVIPVIRYHLSYELKHRTYFCTCCVKERVNGDDGD